MTHAEQLAAFVVRASYDDLSATARQQLKIRVLDALGLDQLHTANALALSGTAFNALRVTRTGTLSHWKGSAYPNTAFGCTHATFLALRGVTGPLEVFEGNKGFIDTIAGLFAIDWSREDLERVTRTVLKAYNAEVHSQAVIEGILELRREYQFTAADVTHITIEIFAVAFHIIGGGEEGEKTPVWTKEEADHSLPYLVAVALLDGQVLPEQYRPERIRGRYAQSLACFCRLRERLDGHAHSLRVGLAFHWHWSDDGELNARGPEGGQLVAAASRGAMQYERLYHPLRDRLGLTLDEGGGFLLEPAIPEEFVIERQGAINGQRRLGGRLGGGQIVADAGQQPQGKIHRGGRASCLGRPLGNSRADLGQPARGT
jgi:2-methylcitrate dehydratase MmgE/PrpD-like protein